MSRLCVYFVDVFWSPGGRKLQGQSHSKENHLFGSNLTKDPSIWIQSQTNNGFPS